MNDFLDWAFALSPTQAAVWLLVANAATFAVAVLLGCLAARLFSRHRITAPAGPLASKEVLFTVAGVAVNTLVSLAGWLLWKAGWLRIGRERGWRAVLDFLVLVLLMDVGMYLLHRLAHWRWLYPIHRLHHEYDRPWALTLFVVHPLETLGFGLLWLAVVVLYGPTWLGLCLYMGANLASGTLGHQGVEPFSAWWSRLPLLREVGTSTFHAQHHRDGQFNFGFYTLLWDRLFGTLLPGYDRDFGREQPGMARHSESPSPQ